MIPMMVLACLLIAPVGATPDRTEYQVVRTFRVADEPACMPAMTRAPNGDVLVAFSTQWEPFPQGGILKLTVSSDQGKTWSKPRILWKDDDPRVTIQVSNGLQTLKNGHIILPVTYCLCPRREKVDPGQTNPQKIYRWTGPGTRREVRFLHSTDDGKTWRREDPKLTKPWWRFGRIVELDNSDLILPGSAWFLRSRDGGKTWGPKESLGTPFHSETNIAQMKDGSLISILRQGGALGPRRAMGTNRSTDRGKTWDKWRWTGFKGKMPDVLVLPSGRALIAVGAEGLSDGSEIFRFKKRRSFCTIFVSDDGGGTWKRDVAVQPTKPDSTVVPADSPVMVPIGDGRILVVCQGIDRAKEGDPLVGYCAGMALIGNVIHPAKGK